MEAPCWLNQHDFFSMFQSHGQLVAEDSSRLQFWRYDLAAGETTVACGRGRADAGPFLSGGDSSGLEWSIWRRPRTQSRALGPRHIIIVY